MEQRTSKTSPEDLQIENSQAIRKRAVLKGIITRIRKFVESFVVENGDLILLQIKHDNLVDTWQKYNDVQSFLELNDIDQETDRVEIEDIVDNLRSKMQKLLFPNQQGLGSRNSDSSKSGSAPSSKKVSSVILPQIDLPKFNGQYDNWLPFSEFFKVLVHNNDALNDIQKFHYLISSLVGPAKLLVKNLPLTHENYTVAWNLLNERYANKRLIAAKHICEILELQRMRRDSANEISNFIDKISSNINALKALELDIPYPELILIQLLTQRLDSKTATTWESGLRPDTFPSLEQFIEFLEKRRQVLESSAVLDLHAKSTNHSSNLIKHGNISCHVTSNKVVPKSQCLFCKQNHVLHKCYKFIKATVGSRISFVKQHHLCFNCLTSNHAAKDCFSSYKCKICNGLHHSLLHIDRTDDDKQSPNETSETKTSGSYCSLKTKYTSSILLATAIVKLKDVDGHTHNCRALLDAGSQANFITESMAQRLKLKRVSDELLVCGISSISTRAKHSVGVTVTTDYSEFTTDLRCYVLPNVTRSVPSSFIDTTNWNIPDNIQLADSSFHTPSKIDLLIGAELFLTILLKGQVSLGSSLPVLQETRLGWIIAGRLPPSKTTDCNISTSLCVIDDTNVQNQLQRFWELEEINTIPRSKEERACEKHFCENTSRDQKGRFIVRLPQRKNCEPLGESYPAAEQRFLQLERKFIKNPTLRNNYVEFMREYLELDHMRLIPRDVLTLEEESNPVYYLPHHAVFKESSTTTKTRVVFDASAKSSNGVSLNDVLMVGPNIQQDIVSITLRFRTHRYAMTADITKMYRQISIHAADYDLQRIVWRKSPQEEMGHYHLTTVTYGTAPASFLATRCLAQVASENSQDFPRAAEIIRADFYVDDLLTGGDNLKETVELQRQIIEILDKYGFSLHKWCSNYDELLDMIPEHKRETQLPLKFRSNENIHTLGLIWDPLRDILKYEISIKPNNELVTKRSVLSTIASIYDPLGLLGPVISSYKIFMQQLWYHNLNWDDRLPSALHETWLEMYKQLPLLKDISIPRLVKGVGQLTDMQIHGFADASEKCYGACLYLRCTDSGGNVSVKLLCAKSRVSPVKQVTLPRLELCATLLLARLVNKIVPILRLDVKKVYLWTDSTVVLAWISATPTKWKTFVANRISEIQELTETCQWGHVNSTENPADILSRGTSSLILQNHSLWWNGPSWLYNDSIHWPQPLSESAEECNMELRKQVLHVSVNQPIEELLLSFSSLPKMLRILSYCLRFAHNTRYSESKNTSPLTALEVRFTLLQCLKYTQKIYFAEELHYLRNKHSVSKKSKVYNLNPFLDEDGCIRVGGRLQHSNLDFAKKHPYILPAKAHLTKLIVENEHVRLLHAGTQLVLSSLRQRFWIVNGRNTIRHIIHQCLKCFRFRATEAHQLMGQLPKGRVQASRPFLNCGVDYAGPFILRQGGRRSKTKIKCYVALFICLSTKAIHLELVSDLTTEAFIAALRRFTARRGISSNIYSDNGTNFVGANNLLRSFSKLLNNKDFKQSVALYTSTQGIQWHFIPPSSPHFGGLWEAGVKSLKYHLRRVVGNVCLNYEEFSTVLTQIEACLNSRPICQLSSDPSDPEVLTPGHFLVGGPLTSLPEPDYTHFPTNRLNRWQLAQQCIQQVWSRWSRDYLNQLQQRSKWNTQFPNLQPGMLILLKEDNTPSLQWKMAVVEEVHPGSDGLVRVASVRTSSGVFKRPIHKLCPLPIND